MVSFAETVFENAKNTPKMTALSALGFIITTVLILTSWLKQRKLSGPGPATLPIIGNFHQMAAHIKAHFVRKVNNLFQQCLPDFVPTVSMLTYADLIPWMSSLFQKYGETVTLWMGPQMIVVTCDPNVIQAYYQSKQSNENFVKGVTDTILSACVGDGVMTSGGAKWKHNRKVISPTFSQVVINNFVPIFEKNSKGLLQELRPNADGKTMFPVYFAAAKYLSKTILESAIQMDDSDSDKAFELLSNVENVMNCIIARTFNPMIHSDLVFKHSATGKRFYENFKPIMSFLTSIYRQAVEKGEKSDFEGPEEWKKNVFINRLVNRSDFDEAQTLNEMTTLIAAGYATSLCTFGFTLLLLGLHPEIQQSVFEEDQAIRSQVGDSPLTANHVNQYELLDRVIKESMRLCTVVPLIFRHLTEDLKIGDSILPKGTELMIDLRLTHNNPKYFPDPHIFNPDRFLPENVSKRHPYAYLPFSLGSRMCLGYKFSQMSLRIFIAEVVRNFKIINNKPLDNLNLRIDMTVRDLDGFQVILEPRS